MELLPQSAVVIRWTFMACVILVFGMLFGLAIFLPQQFRAGLMAARALFPGHS